MKEQDMLRATADALDEIDRLAKLAEYCPQQYSGELCASCRRVQERHAEAFARRQGKTPQ